MKRVLIAALMLIFLLAGCGSKTTVNNQQGQSESIKKNINIYFGDGSVNLIKEQRTVEYKTNDSLEKKILEELIAGPKTSTLKALVLTTTKINSVKVNNGTAVVDLSGEFLTGLNGGSEAENLRIYSLVDTLTELPNIKKVQFLIDGQKGKLLGDTELDGDFERDETVIRK